MATDLRGRAALVTGASGGIGSDIAVRLAAAGCDVAIHYRGDEAGARAVEARAAAHGVRTAVLQANLGDPDGAAGLIDEVQASLGPLDVLVANAGIATPVQDIADVTLGQWHETIALNLTAPFLLTQAALPGMVRRGFGRVLLVSSVAAFTGGLVGPHYAASKAGLHGMLFWLAKRVAGSGVTVNAVAPAVVASGMVPEDSDTRALPLGRIGRPEEVGELAMAMLTNAYVTGKVFLADGGIHPH